MTQNNSGSATITFEEKFKSVAGDPIDGHRVSQLGNTTGYGKCGYMVNV